MTGAKEPDLAAHVAERMPELAPAGTPEPLAGGLLNRVWRLPVRGGTVVAKWAPPYVASRPEIPLSPERLCFEAAALAELAPGGSLAGVPDGAVRPPRLLHHDRTRSLLLLEDLGPLPDLGAAAPPQAGELARRLGAFVARLHRQSAGSERLAARFQNLDVQRTRLEVQYRQVESFLAAAGLAEAARLGAIALDLGKRLLEPGRCLIMGDLWPPSILVAGEELRVIDWELSHFGSPAQDVGHLAAHLWMRGAEDARRAFLDAYQAGLGEARAALWGEPIQRDAVLHFACEIAARAAGPFRAGTPYADLDPSAPACRAALAAAARHLADPRWP